MCSCVNYIINFFGKLITLLIWLFSWQLFKYGGFYQDTEEIWQGKLLTYPFHTHYNEVHLFNSHQF